MKQLFTSLFILTMTCGFSQVISQEPSINEGSGSQQNFQITIENISLLVQETELSFDLASKGAYTFKLSHEFCPGDNYTAILKDPRTGNSFDLRSEEPHSFSISRPMTKNFILHITKTPEQILSCKE